MAVKNGADVIMTSYGAVNNMWTSGSYDLNTLILRKDWGFKGIVMTDWWASTNNEGEKPEDYNIAQNVRAQNDIFMVVPDAAEKHLSKERIPPVVRTERCDQRGVRHYRICGYLYD